MAYSESQKRAIEKGQKEKVDDIRVRVPKGQRDIIKAHAAKHNETINAFVNRAINHTMDWDDAQE